MRTLGIEQGCMLCGERNETRDHLFFACPYSSTVWINMTGKLFGEAISPDWVDTITMLLHSSHSRLDRVHQEDGFSDCSLYHLEKESRVDIEEAGYRRTLSLGVLKS